MSAAREETLARVRAAKAGKPTAPATPAPGAAAHTLTRNYRHTDPRPHHDLVALFCERVDDYRAEVERVDAARLAEAIIAAAARHGARRLAIPAQLRGSYRPPELDLVTDDALSPRGLDRLDGVITGCTVAIAETGTIALSAAADEGRRQLSLVPDLHICVVRERQIVGTVPEAITQLSEIARGERRPITLISGPSATSDIELQRIEGVHGPRRLVVLLTEEPHDPARSATGSAIRPNRSKSDPSDGGSWGRDLTPGRVASQFWYPPAVPTRRIREPTRGPNSRKASVCLASGSGR